MKSMLAMGSRPGRLTRRPEFLRVRNGEKRRGAYFLLEVLDRDNDQPPRIGYTVTKKQGNAVERNRMKRRLREAVRLKGRFAMKPGHDYVVVARRDALDAPFSILTDALVNRINGSGQRAKTAGKRNG